MNQYFTGRTFLSRSRFLQIHSSIKLITTRMHSSRMRTVRCISRLLGAVSARGGVCPGGVGCLPGGMSARGVSAQGDACVCPGGGICLGVSAQGGVYQTPPMNRHLWKHYLAATTLQTAINDNLTPRRYMCLNLWLHTCLCDFTDVCK